MWRRGICVAVVAVIGVSCVFWILMRENRGDLTPDSDPSARQLLDVALPPPQMDLVEPVERRIAPLFPEEDREEDRGLAPDMGFLSVEVLDDFGIPVSAVPVVVTSSMEPWTKEEVVTDGDGRAEIQRLPSLYTIFVNSGGENPGYEGYIREELALAAGQSIHTVAVLRRTTASLCVRVVDDTGAPLEGIGVKVMGSLVYPMSPTGTTDEEGMACWTPIVPGHWGVEVEDKSEMRVDTRQAPRQRVEIQPYGSARVDFVLVRLGEVFIRIHDVLDFTDIRRIEIDAQRARSHRAPWNTPEIAWRVPKGSYEIRSSWSEASDLWSPPVRVDVEPGERVEAKILPERGSLTLKGAVVDHLGNRIENALVSANIREDWLILMGKSVRTSSDGSWELRGLIQRGKVVLGGGGRQATGRYLADWLHVDESDVQRAVAGEAVQLLALSGYKIRVRISAEWIRSCKEDLAELKFVRLDAPTYRLGWNQSPSVGEDGTFVLEHREAGIYSLRLEGTRGRELLGEHVIVVPPETPEGAELFFDLGP